MKDLSFKERLLFEAQENFNYALGNATLAQGAFNEAVTFFHRCLQLNADHHGALQNLERALLGLGRLEEAATVHGRLVGLGGPPVDGLLDLAKTCLLQNRTKEAIALLRTGLEAGPDSGALHQELGIALIQEGRQEEAVEHFAQAAHDGMAGIDEFDCLSMARLCKQFGSLTVAEALMRRALSLSPRNAAIYTDLGMLLRGGGRSVEACQCLEQALMLDPRDVKTMIFLGEIYRTENEPEKALATLDRLYEIRDLIPAAEQVWLPILRSHALTALDRFEEGVEEARRGVAELGESNLLLGSLGYALQAAGQYAEAESVYHSALKFNPPLADLYVHLASVKRQDNRLEEAVAACRKALELSSGLVLGYVHLGGALLALGRGEEALYAHRKGADLAPGHAYALIALGATLRELGHLQDAEGVCRQAMALNVNLPWPHLYLGDVLHARGDLVGAVQAYRQGLNRKPTLGFADLYLGSARQAGALLERARALVGVSQ